MRTAVAPPALVSARAPVERVIAEGATTSSEAPRVISLWHTEVQGWQDNDELATAFQEGRLTFRTMSHTGGKYAYGDLRDESRKRVLGLINNDDYERTITNAATQSGGVWEKGGLLPENKNVLLDAGGAGIKRRLDPTNFISDARATGSRSNKFRLGLHDLSASLLNPDGYVLKKYAGINLVVLMPLPLPKDVEIFYRLRQLSKSGGSPAFKTAVEVLASQFTRPKLASGLDMGTTYVVATSTRHGGDSVKYVKGKGPAVTSKDSPTQCVKTAREDYLTILKGSTSGANEITLAYRQCGTRNKFPVFAISIPNSEYFEEVDIRLPGQQGGYADYIETGFLISGVDFSRATKESRAASTAASAASAAAM